MSGRRYGYGRYPRKVAFGMWERMQKRNSDNNNEYASLGCFIPWITAIILFMFLASCGH